MKHEFFSAVEEALFNEKIQLVDREDSPYDWAYNRRLCAALKRGLPEKEAKAVADSGTVVYGD